MEMAKSTNRIQELRPSNVSRDIQNFLKIAWTVKYQSLVVHDWNPEIIVKSPIRPPIPPYETPCMAYDECIAGNVLWLMESLVVKLY